VQGAHACPALPQTPSAKPGWHTPLESQHPPHVAMLHTAVVCVGAQESPMPTAITTEKRRIAAA
jgi:hypothetical protein